MGTSNESNEKVIILDHAKECPQIVNNDNWLHTNYGDTFSVDQRGKQLIIRRTDKDKGWSMNLAFECCGSMLFFFFLKNTF